MNLVDVFLLSISILWHLSGLHRFLEQIHVQFLELSTGKSLQKSLPSLKDSILMRVNCWLDKVCFCHDRDCTYPCSPYPDLPTSFPSHQNHPQAPNATPKPSGSILSQLTSQQHTPKHSDSLLSSQHIPNPTLL